MMMTTLFASTEAASFFPETFWPGVVGTLIYCGIAFVLCFVAYKVIDWVTPGDLDKQLLGKDEGQNGQPNLALAIVVGMMFLGVCVIIAAAIK